MIRCKSIILLTLGLLLPGAASQATCPPPHAQCPLAPGEMGLFFDAEGTQSCRPVLLGETVELYVVVRVPPGGIESFGVGSLSMEGASLVSAEGTTIAPGFRHLTLIDGCDEGEAIDPASCPTADGEVVALAAFTATRLEEDLVCVGSFCNDTIAGPSPPGSYPPWYRSCEQPDDIVHFELGFWGCLQLSSFPVAADVQRSWSVLKADFRR